MSAHACQHIGVSSWHCDAHEALLSWYHSLPAALIGMWINNIIVPADCCGFGYWGREMLLDSSRYYTTIKETKLYKSFGAWGERQQNWIWQANLKLAEVFSYHSLTQLLYIFFFLTSEYPIEAMQLDFYKSIESACRAELGKYMVIFNSQERAIKFDTHMKILGPYLNLKMQREEPLERCPHFWGPNEQHSVHLAQGI